jgi:hypothetical protein
MKISFTKLFGVAVMLLIHIRGMLGSNLGRDTGYHGISQSLQPNAGIVPQLGKDSFLSNPFKFIIHLSSYRPTLYSILIDIIGKYPTKNKISLLDRTVVKN